jgi:hypothetical protein
MDIRTFLPVLLFWCGACASSTPLLQSPLAVLNTTYQTQVVELRSSLYYGDLYDENEFYMLSPYPFAHTSHINDLKGKPIFPRHERGIVPAGTRFVVQRIAFADMSEKWKRMWTTPRDYPWVILQATENQTHLPAVLKPFVVVLPLGMTKPAEVHEAMHGYFGKEGEIKAWLQDRKPTVRVAIFHKDIVPGMTYEELVAAKGVPQQWFSDKEGELQVRVAWYPEGQEAWFVDNQITQIKSSRPPDG